MYFLLFIRKQSVLSVNVSAINCSYAQKGICPSSKRLLTVQSKWKNRGDVALRHTDTRQCSIALGFIPYLVSSKLIATAPFLILVFLLNASILFLYRVGYSDYIRENTELSYTEGIKKGCQFSEICYNKCVAIFCNRESSSKWMSYLLAVPNYGYVFSSTPFFNSSYTKHALFASLPRCRQSTMPPHRLFPSPCTNTNIKHFVIEGLRKRCTRIVCRKFLCKKHISAIVQE